MPKHVDPEILARMRPDEKIFVTEKGYSNPEFVDIDDVLAIFYDRNGKTPDDHLLTYVKDKRNYQWMLSAVNQGKKLLARDDFPWRYIDEQANFGSLTSDEQSVRIWFTHVISLIEENLPQKSAE